MKLLILLFLIFSSCATVPKQPWWIEKRLNKPEILEGVGYATGLKDRKALRDSAYNDAIQKLILSSSIQVNGYIETRLFAERDLGINRATGGELLDNVNKVIYDTVLDRKFFEEYYNKSTGEYWVYVWIPMSTVGKITAEQTLKTLDKSISASEKMKQIRKDLEKDLENYKRSEEKELQILKPLIEKNE